MICGSNNRDPLHDGHRLGLVRRSSLNTKPQSLHFAGMTSIRYPAAAAVRSECRRSSSTSSRRSPISRAIDDTDRGAFESSSISSRLRVMASSDSTAGVKPLSSMISGESPRSSVVQKETAKEVDRL